ncbi:MAG: hypothetical protein PUQ00_02745 [Nostoc sp. S13]|nr:hypothetical protein [Nostoc sp. S13]
MPLCQILEIQVPPNHYYLLWYLIDVGVYWRAFSVAIGLMPLVT